MGCDCCVKPFDAPPSIDTTATQCAFFAFDGSGRAFLTLTEHGHLKNGTWGIEHGGHDVDGIIKTSFSAPPNDTDGSGNCIVTETVVSGNRGFLDSMGAGNYNAGYDPASTTATHREKSVTLHADPTDADHIDGEQHFYEQDLSEEITFRWRVQHFPATFCYLKVWFCKTDTVDPVTGIPALVDYASPYEWRGTGSPCFPDPTKPATDAANLISGDWNDGIPSGGVFVKKYTFVERYEPDDPAGFARDRDGALFVARPDPDSKPNGYPL